MKKYVLSLVLIASVAMVSCGSGSSTTKPTSDSTEVKVDTLSVKTDSVKVDSTSETPVK